LDAPGRPGTRCRYRGAMLYCGKVEEDDIRAAVVAAGSSAPKRGLE
jgi:hypothetical protein